MENFYRSFIMSDLFLEFIRLEEVVVGKFDREEINSILLNRYINLLNKINNKEEVDGKKVMKIMLLINS